MNGFKLGTNPIYVGYAFIPGELIDGMKILNTMDAQPTIPPTPPIIQGSIVNEQESLVESVDSEENFSIKGSQRYIVMQKLAQRQEMIPSKVIRIDNSVLAGEVDDSLREDFEQECSKFGDIQRIVIDTDPDPKGQTRIFIQFNTIESAKNAQKALHERWFAGRQLSVSFYSLTSFLAGKYQS
jgi:RNA recognition motif-containing protein